MATRAWEERGVNSSSLVTPNGPADSMRFGMNILISCTGLVWKIHLDIYGYNCLMRRI